ncbi:MAG: hypothetical protein ACKO6N_23895 [Myxococcota bacterium]
MPEGYLRVEVREPSGLCVALPIQVQSADGHTHAVKTEQVLRLPLGPVVLHFSHPTGKFSLELQAGSQPDAPQVLSLQLAELLVWASDPGGRDFGGLSVLVQSPGGELRGRVGVAFSVWAGQSNVLVGNPVAGVAYRQLDEDIKPSRTTLELGRLGALVVRWGEAHGWAVLAHPLDEALSVERMEASQVSPQRLTTGRTGEPLLLWSGLYRVGIEGGEGIELLIRGGQLTELDLEAYGREEAEGAAAAGNVAGNVAGIRLGHRLKDNARAWMQKGLLALAEKLGPGAGEAPLPPGVEKGEGRPAGAGILLQRRDARGYPLTGYPYTLSPVGGGKSQRGCVGRWCALPAGRYRLQLDGMFPAMQPVEVLAEARVLELPPLASLETVLRDGLGCSLRGASYWITQGGQRLAAAFSQPTLLEPGSYALELPTRPAQRLEVVVEPGVARVIDAGALGQVDTTPSEDAPFGTPLKLEPVALKGEGFEVPASGESPSSAMPVVEGWVGQALHVVPGTYMLRRSDQGGEPELITIKAGRMRRPSVLGRGHEALAGDDHNRG